MRLFPAAGVKPPALGALGALVAVAVGGAVGCHGDRSYSAGPAALIEDGSHGNGNAFFFWLPPLVNQQAPAEQVFSRQLDPTVSISNLCSGAVIRTLSGADVQIADAAYHANWHTPDDYLDPTCTYRIAVQTGSRQLGVVDVDVVDDGRELKNVDTGEYIALLDDSTLPIQFFIGVGSQCERTDSDCGEGTAQPDQTTTIVTTHGQAGVVIPAGALDQPATIIIESADDRPCIAELPEPVFSGSIGPIGNSCYDIHTEPPLAQVNALGRFNTNVTVGICAETGSLDHVTQDLLQIFQLHVGATPAIRALRNVGAPFLSCEPAYPQLLGYLAARLGALFVPRPLHATTTMTLHIGAGGETDMYSRFTWALPSQQDMNFDQAPDLSAILPGAAVNSVYSPVGVTFSRTRPLSLLCTGSSVYANDYGLLGTGLLGFGSGQNNISVCPLGIASDFSEFGYGAITATFAVPAAESCISATPTGYHGILPPPGGVAFIEALDANGNVLSRTESTTERAQQRLCVRGVGIAAVRFAGKDAAYAIFDDLRWTRVLPAN
ncbi:MAG TPA: hypothetical protein VEK77_15480 [Gemmatimonadales bacterium]|nr:hypothetical protein [Gemmatimonadales bacterium]